jgi:hypothetical protein
MFKQKISLMDKAAHKATYFGVAFVVAVATLTPLLLSPSANAARCNNLRI